MITLIDDYGDEWGLIDSKIPLEPNEHGLHEMWWFVVRGPDFAMKFGQFIPTPIFTEWWPS